MRYSYIAAPLALAAGASAWGNGTIKYTTEVLTAFTTYCPAATSFTHGSSTYVVTEATTLTITNCPCTVTKPIVSSTPLAMPTSAAPIVSSAPAVVPTSSPAEGATSAVSAPVSVTPAPSVAPVGTAPIGTAPVAPSGAPIVSVAPPTFVNSTTPAVPLGTAAPTGSVAPVKSTTPFTGAANKMAASGASMAALLGLAVYFL